MRLHDHHRRSAGPDRHGRVSALLLIAVLLAFIAGVSSQLSDRSDSEPAQAVFPNGASVAEAEGEKGGLRRVPIVVAKLTDDFAIEHTYTGRVESSRVSPLSFQRADRLDSVSAEEGDYVEAGSVLAELNCRRPQASLDMLAALRAEAAARLEEVRSGARPETIESLREEVAGLEAQRSLQANIFQRVSGLSNRGTATDQEMDQARFTLDAVEARYRAMRQQLNELESGSRTEHVKAAEAAVRSVDAQIEQARIELDDSKLVAPFSGFIVARHADEGTVVTPGSPVLEIVESGTAEVRVSLPESVAASLTSEDQLTLLSEQRVLAARLKRRIPLVDRHTRTQTCILEPVTGSASESNEPLSERNGRRGMPFGLVHGRSVRVVIRRPVGQSGYRLPISALTRSAYGTWAVLVAVPHVSEVGESMSAQRNTDQVARLERRLVEVLRTDGSDVLIRGTITEGDRIVTDGTHTVVPDQLVIPIAVAFDSGASGSGSSLPGVTGSVRLTDGQQVQQ